MDGVGLAITTATAASFLFLSLLFLFITAYFKFYRQARFSHAAADNAELGHPRVAPAPAAALIKAASSARRFKSAEIDALAVNFTPTTMIGAGGFSTVYLASLRRPPSLAAVKVLNSSQRLHRAFRQELDVLLRVDHPHIVRLLGYCEDRDEGVLVFEFVPNGTLHDAVTSGSGGGGAGVLPWPRRASILFSLALALEYLHERCELQIIHGDIKSSNVLLDNFFEPKLCDFGCARMGFSATVTRSAVQMMGSLGYVDPYYLRTGQVSKKSDVYSFGVLVLELITGAEAFDPDKEQLLTTVMRPALQSFAAGGEATTRACIDPKLGSEYDADEVLAMTAIAAKCVTEQPALRPSMADVVKMMREKVHVIQQKPE